MPFYFRRVVMCAFCSTSSKWITFRYLLYALVFAFHILLITDCIVISFSSLHFLNVYENDFTFYFLDNTFVRYTIHFNMRSHKRLFFCTSHTLSIQFTYHLYANLNPSYRYITLSAFLIIHFPITAQNDFSSLFHFNLFNLL